MNGWRPVGVPGRASNVVASVWMALGLGWLAWPVWDSVGAPGGADVRAEAPWLIFAQVAGLALLAVVMWRESGGGVYALTASAALVAANCVLRTSVSPGTAGVEVVHVLPLLAGAGLGLAPGVLVGAASALATTMVASTPAETLPSQCVVWACVGALGAVLRVLPTVAAWLVAVPLALGAGVASGLLLNLIGWSQDSGTSTDHFVPGIPPLQVLERLWLYTLETSLALDAVRGLTTALAVAVVGLPVLRMLRGPDHRPTTTTRPEERRVAAAVRRREDSARIDELWATGPEEQEQACRT